MLSRRLRPGAVTDTDTLVMFRRSDVIVTGPVFRMDAYPLLETDKGARSLGEVNRSQYRAFQATANDLDYERWSLDAWTIIRKPSIPQQWEKFRGWGVSDRYDGPVPPLGGLSSKTTPQPVGGFNPGQFAPAVLPP